MAETEFDDTLMTPGEVAELFQVHPKTVTRWAKAGTLPVATRTLGGHRRFASADVTAILERSRGQQ